MSRRPALPSFTLGAGAVAAGAVAAVTNRGLRHRARVRRRTEHVTRIATPDGPLLASYTYGRPEDSPGTIVLVHGWTMAAAFWTGAAEALSRQGWHVVTYDQRGHGRSAPVPADGFGLRRLGGDLQAVLDQTVPEGHPVVLAGHSMGAMSVMAWAGREQAPTHDVRGAALVCSSAHGVVPDAVAALTGANQPQVQRLLRTAVHVPVEVPRTPINRAVVRMIAFGESPSPAQVELTHRLFLECPPSVRVGFAREMDSLDLRDCASALSVPTVVLGGGKDRLTPPAHAEQLAELTRAETLRIVPEAGHQLPLERPGLVVDTISGLARRVVPAVTGRSSGRATGPAMDAAQ